MKITEIKWEDGKQYKLRFKSGKLGSTIYTVEGEELVDKNDRSELEGGSYRLISENITMQDIVEAELEEVVDWSKVPVDTRIYIGDYEADNRYSKHFAKYENGKVYYWTNGKTSWTAHESEIAECKYYRLAE